MNLSQKLSQYPDAVFSDNLDIYYQFEDNIYQLKAEHHSYRMISFISLVMKNEKI